MKFKEFIRKIAKRFVLFALPELKKVDLDFIKKSIINSEIAETAKVYSPYNINNSHIGAYTYIAPNSQISYATIGKFCSIGPDFKCGWGIHPTKGISTSPMFYSTYKQNGITLSEKNKIEERKQIKIGNDVFIGRNVTVLDGITIGDGAVIGAGAVVSKDIPPFAIAVGSPIKVIRYRFTEEQRNKLMEIKWWDFNEENLKEVEKYFFDIDIFLKKYE